MKEPFNINTLVRPNIAVMTAYSSARDEYTELDNEMIFLDANENPFENGVNRYPDPQQGNLKTLLAQQKNVSSSQILAGNGSDEVLDLLFRAFCEPRVDAIITVPPTYGMYKVLAQTNDIKNREVLLNKDFQLDVDGVLKAIDAHTKMIFVCTPNNPTGNLIAREDIIFLLENFNGLLVIDEAYIDFAAAESWSTQLGKYPNLVVTQTLSKAYGLAGIRLGLCYASQEIIAILNKIKPPYNVNSLTQAKAHERVSDLAQVNKEVETILDGKAKLTSALREVSFVKQVFPSDANFVLARVDDADKRYKQLIAKGIVVRNRSSQPLCENTLRFTIGTVKEINNLVSTLKIIS